MGRWLERSDSTTDGDPRISNWKYVQHIGHYSALVAAEP